METATLTIDLPREDLEFARQYAEEHHMTLAELLDHQLRRLRAEQAEGPAAVPAITEDLLQDSNFAAYQREKERLQSEHPGEYVAYCRGMRAARASSQAALLSLLDAKFPDEPCFVQHISQEPRRVTFRRPRRVLSLALPR